MKLASWFGEPLDFFHFRDKEKNEVDVVIEDADRRVVGIEVKATATATARWYGRLGLSEREFRLLKEQMSFGSHMFLIKRGRHSIVCQLDLKGSDTELAVITRRADNRAPPS
jgi:hypothetical protein